MFNKGFCGASKTSIHLIKKNHLFPTRNNAHKYLLENTQKTRMQHFDDENCAKYHKKNSIQ